MLFCLLKPRLLGPAPHRTFLSTKWRLDLRASWVDERLFTLLSNYLQFILLQKKTKQLLLPHRKNRNYASHFSTDPFTLIPFQPYLLCSDQIQSIRNNKKIVNCNTRASCQSTTLSGLLEILAPTNVTQIAISGNPLYEWNS